MLKLPTSTQSSCGYSYLVFQKPWINLQGGKIPLLLGRSIPNQKKQKRVVRVRCCSSGMNVKAVATIGEGGRENTENKSAKVKVTLTVLQTVEGYFSEVGFNRGIDDIAEFLGKSLQVELLSAQLEPS